MTSAALRHVYWIGGGSGAGKSTVARRVAARHGLRLYPTDDVMPDHGRRITPPDAPMRDRMFTERLRAEATSLQLTTIGVDTTMTEDDLTEKVTEAFGL